MELTFEIELPSGRGRRCQVVARGGGKIVATFCGELVSAEGRRRLARQIGEKFGLADVAAIEKRLDAAWTEALNRREQEPAEGPLPASPPQYHDAAGYLCQERTTAHGMVTHPLANFTAQIAEQTVLDDGGERTTFYTVEGQLADGRKLPRVEVVASEFPWMRWPSER